jgi:hypothetical protein
MKRNVLLLVHVEETFRKHFPDAMYVPRLIHSCKARKYDEVIHCTSMMNDMRPILEIVDLIDMEIDWAWGYEPDLFGDEEIEWVIPARYSLHEWTWCPEELRNGRLDNCVVWLGGGHYCECLADMCAVLKHLGIEFYIIDGLTYGQ